MRFPVFIPLVLCNIFCIMMLISSFVVGPAWKFYFALFGVILFTVTSIIAGSAILREGERQNHHH